MKKNLFTSLAVALGVSAARWIGIMRHPEWSAPTWLPVAVAFIGGFIGSFVTLIVIALFRKKCTRKEPPQ